MSKITDPRICDEGGGGLWLPLFGEAEQRLNKTLRALIYGSLLFYTFLGVNIVADAFMAAIEAVTSSKRRVFNKSTGRYVTVLVWNDTVKNLSLLALGSSAPEILLSVIETLSNEFFSGALGPSTIVGSAAFNLLVIISVCVVAIESPDVRFIKEITVYNITAIFSLFAYTWLLIIVEYSSKDVIDMWEAVVTLVMFPFLVGISFAADVGVFPFRKQEANKPVSAGEIDEEIGYAESDKGSVKKTSKLSGRARRVSMKQSQLESKVVQKSGSQTALDEDANLSRSPLPNGSPALQMQTLPAGDDGELIRQDGKPIINPRGVITFCSDTMTVMINEDDKMICVPVLRRNGTSGTVSCKFHTEMWSAIKVFDFDEVTGELEFQQGEQQKEISIKIKGKKPKERSDQFQLVLDEVSGGAEFNPNDDGGEESCILTVAIQNEKEGPITMVKSLSTRFLLDADVKKFGIDQYVEQIKAAISIDGGEDEGDDQEPPGMLDVVIHYVSLPWKVLYAITTPPQIFAGGWLLFAVALVHIALITAVICDLASAFGCCINIDDSVTAITVVALGTSLPDLFASQAAARDDDYADASIVNVTGSNSVNVFLGIGIPWLICTIYWQVQGATPEWRGRYWDKFGSTHPNGAFIVEAGTLAFSVTVFTSEAIICITVLRVKRILVGGELGGPARLKNAVGVLLLFLWVTYITLSSIRSKSDAIDFVGKIIMMSLAAIAVIAGFIVELCARSGAIPSQELGGRARAKPIKYVDDAALLPSPDNDKQRLLEVSMDGAAQGEWNIANEAPVDSASLTNGVSVLPDTDEQNPTPKAKSKAKSKANAQALKNGSTSSPKAMAKPSARTVGKQVSPSTGDPKTDSAKKSKLRPGGKSKAGAKKKKPSNGTEADSEATDVSISSAGTGK